VAPPPTCHSAVPPRTGGSLPFPALEPRPSATRLRPEFFSSERRDVLIAGLPGHSLCGWFPTRGHARAIIHDSSTQQADANLTRARAGNTHQRYFRFTAVQQQGTGDPLQSRAPGATGKRYKSAFSYNFVGATLGIKLPVPSTPPGDCAASRSCSPTLSVAGQLLADLLRLACFSHQPKRTVSSLSLFLLPKDIPPR
jgi:hypothetical protein